MKRMILICLMLLLAAIMTHAQKTGFPKLTGPYLGQKPPGLTPEIFAPEFLQANPSWFWHGSPVFSPDGNEMFWTKYVVGKGMRLWYMVKKNKNWLAPKKAAFACDCNENNPFYSEDGNTIYYISEKAGGPLFFVNRTSSGWSLPRNIVLQLPENTGWGWEFSFTKNLELYIGLMNDNKFDLYYAISTKDRYENFKNLGSEINSLDMETTPFIDPDKQFIIFSSNRPDGFGGADLYISFRNSDDTWTESLNMGIEINSASNELWPSVTSDRKYFFFCRLDRAKKGYQPYWVDAKIIKELKPKQPKQRMEK